MKKFLNKFSGKSSTVIWILASVCGILSFIYYLSTGTEIIVAFISAIVVLFLSMLAISVVAGVILGAIELIFPESRTQFPMSNQMTACKKNASMLSERTTTYQILQSWQPVTRIGEKPEKLLQIRDMPAAGCIGSSILTSRSFWFGK